MPILKQDYYDRNTLRVAQDLSGCFLTREINGNKKRYMITEIEAYRGPDDKASHASRGITPRTKVMFGPPGRIYIYLVYGRYYMLNIVTEKAGYPAAVLIRAVSGHDGPGKLTKALGIDMGFNNKPIYVKKYGLWIEDRTYNIKPGRIKRCPRIGVDYAEEYRDKPWRFIFS